VGFLVTRLALEQVHFRVPPFPTVSNIPLMLRIHLHIQKYAEGQVGEFWGAFKKSYGVFLNRTVEKYQSLLFTN
jgi:hypothetical protein